MANLIFELEKKLSDSDSPGVRRNIQRMKDVLDEAGILLMNPMGELYQDTRTDLEANITSTGNGSPVVLDVIKPVLYAQQDGAQTLLQKGVVIVGTKS